MSFFHSNHSWYEVHMKHNVMRDGWKLWWQQETSCCYVKCKFCRRFWLFAWKWAQGREKHKGKGNVLDALCTLRNFSNSLTVLYFENITWIQRKNRFLENRQSDLDDRNTNDSNAIESALHYIFFIFIFFGWTAYATSNRTIEEYTSDHPQQSNKYLVCQSL